MDPIDTLPETWSKIAAIEIVRIEAEMERELCPLHPLYDLVGHCVGRRDGEDDFLFYFPTHPKPVVVVHLTWSREETSDFPSATFFTSAEDFSQNWRRIFD